MNLNKCGPFCWIVDTGSGVSFCMIHDYRTDDSFAKWSQKLLQQAKENEANQTKVAHETRLPNFAL